MSMLQCLQSQLFDEHYIIIVTSDEHFSFAINNQKERVARQSGTWGFLYTIDAMW